MSDSFAAPHDCFLTAEVGAVTVDWVVLTAALVGLGIATISVVTTGLDSQSGNIDSTLRGVQIVTAFDRLFADDDFESGLGNWTGGELREINGFGNVLALSGSAASADLPIEVSDTFSHAVIEFDMIIGDSWDGETGSITLNGEEVVLGTHRHGGGIPDVGSYDGTDSSTAITYTAISHDSGNTGAYWNDNGDHSYRVRIVTTNDGSPLSLGASTTLNQGSSDEFFALDNVTVRGTSTPDS